MELDYARRSDGISATIQPRVLAVDDQRDYLDALEALLCGEGYEVETTTSVTDALERARIFNPDLFVTDLNMVPVDGVDLLRKVDEQRLLRGVPRMILSSAPAEVVYRRMREAGIEADVVDKNGDIATLLTLVARLCRRLQ